MKDLSTSSEQKDRKPEPERKIIKFDTPEKPGETKKEDTPQQDPKKKMADTTKIDVKKTEAVPAVFKIGDKIPGASADAAREDLEQRRTILQNMKDFDFQIKKNQEDLSNLNEKVENLSKDLDDLVSLYEIVSEQMNPFVGLSKVTKKRIDALENFTKEVETVKNRIGDLESLFEKNGFSMEGGNHPNQMIKPVVEEKASTETPTVTTNPPDQRSSNVPLCSETPLNQVKPTMTPEQTQSATPPSRSERDLDELLGKSLESLLVEQNIDNIINEFFLSLK